MAQNRIHAAKKLIATADIQSVSLIEARMVFDGRKEGSRAVRPPHKGRMAISVSHSGRARIKEEGAISAVVRFVLRATEAGKEETESIFRVNVSFELVYKVPADLAPSEAELRAFGDTNAVFNAWPYWREFVQSMTARANLPPLTLPLFRVLP